MRKYLLHVLIILFVFLLAPTAQVASYAGEIEDTKEEVRDNPDDADAHYYLGNAYFKSGKYQKALESFKQAIRIDPDHVYAHFNLGVTYLGLNDRGSALEQYEILKKLDTELANELFNFIYSE